MGQPQVILIAYYEKECWIINQCINYVLHALDLLSIPYELTHGNDVLKNFNKDKHKLVIALHPTGQIIPDLGKFCLIPATKIWWDFESPYEIDTVKQGIYAFDLVYTFCGNSAENIKNAKIRWLPTATDTTIYFKQEVEDRYKTDVLLIGNAFPSRIAFLKSREEEWKGKKVLIIGLGYQQLYGNGFVYVNQILPPEECAKYYNGADIILEPQRTVDDADLGQNKEKINPNFKPFRHWDILACKGADLQGHTFTQLVKDWIQPYL